MSEGGLSKRVRSHVGQQAQGILKVICFFFGHPALARSLPCSFQTHRWPARLAIVVAGSEFEARFTSSKPTAQL